MVTPSQLIERANNWLREKGVGLLSPHEIIYVIKKMVEYIDKSNGIDDLEQKLAWCTATVVCELRGYKTPNMKEGE